jgi:hypothetical protein
MNLFEELSSDTRRQVYVNFREIFEEEKREGRDLNRGRIKKLVKKKESLQPLRKRLGHSVLLSLVWKMVDEGIFESALRAWREFPELFPSRPRDDTADDLHQGADVEGYDGKEGDGSGHDLTEDELSETPPVGDGDAGSAVGASGQHGTISVPQLGEEMLQRGCGK